MIEDPPVEEPLWAKLSDRRLDIGRHAEGFIFNPGPEDDLLPITLNDADLSRAYAIVSGVSGETKRKYEQAAYARIILAKFREQQRAERVDLIRDEIRLRDVAAGGRQLFLLSIRRDSVEFRGLAGLLLAGMSLASLIVFLASFFLLSTILPCLVIFATLPAAFVVNAFLEKRGRLFRSLANVLALFLSAPLIVSAFSIIVGDIRDLAIEIPAAAVWVIFGFGSVGVFYVALEFFVFNAALQTLTRMVANVILKRSDATEGVVLASLIETIFTLSLWPRTGQHLPFIPRPGIGLPRRVDRLTMRQIEETAGYALQIHTTAAASAIDEQVREFIRGRGRGIAVTLRHHGGLLLMPGHSKDAVARSLFNGLMSAAEGNWANLVQIEPDSGVKSTIRRYAPRVTIALVFALIAIVAPTIAGFIPPGQEAYVRVYLLLAAIFALFGTDISKVRETVLGLTKDTLGRSNKG